jgi:molybdopterin converting factor small subunit
MRVTVVCFGAMRDYLPPGSMDNRADIEIAVGATVADVAAALGAPTRLLHAILVNGERADLAKGLSEGEEVTLMPPFAGG